MKKIEEKSAKTIQKAVKKLVCATTGRSIPHWMYEEEIPSAVQKWVKKQKISKENF